MTTTSDEPDVSAHELSRLSLWSATQAPQRFPALSTDLSVDVAIVGAGITGITAAAHIAGSGRTVAVLEARRVGQGTTGHATGNLYALVDEYLHTLAKKWGDDHVSAIVQSRIRAINAIEQNVAAFHLDCQFSRQPMALYSTTDALSESRDIEAEYHAAIRAGLDARMTNDLPLPFIVKKAMVVRNQAQFHPLRYVQQLAAAIHSQQCRIHEESAVVDIDEKNGVVNTAAHTVRADHIILATHTPKGFNLVQTELGPYREYAVAAQLREPQLPGGIFWSIGQKPTSTRAVMLNGKSYVMMIGEKHKTGQNTDPEAAYRTLAELLRARFAVQSIDYQWSAQHYRAADGLPYIGSSAGASSLYIATGFATDGLTYGTVAGKIIADEICGADNPYAALYSPRRFTPVKSAKNFLKENLNVAGRYIRDYATSPALKHFSNVKRGEGALVDVEGAKLAVYRDDADRLHILSPVCTHMKCIVQWNRTERSWDCPCHGSRFNYDGAVIEGPALMPLRHHDTAAEVDSDAVSSP